MGALGDHRQLWRPKERNIVKNKHKLGGAALSIKSIGGKQGFRVEMVLLLLLAELSFLVG